jgi:hypothetical protein
MLAVELAKGQLQGRPTRRKNVFRCHRPARLAIYAELADSADLRTIAHMAAYRRVDMQAGVSHDEPY